MKDYENLIFFGEKIKLTLCCNSVLKHKLVIELREKALDGNSAE